MRMQDRDIVAAIVAGDPAGLAEAYDTYAATLYSYCRYLLPPIAEDGASASSGTFEDLADRDGAKASGGLGDEAAQTVRDTFIVSVSRLGVLRDPDRLGAWLQAVARNECVRRLQARNPGSTVKAADPPGPPPEVALPDGLKEQVLQSCTDSTPAGRAYGVSVVHRAGAFDRTGFPRPAEPQGPEWWRRARERPRVLAAVAAFLVPAAVAALIVALTVGGSPRTPAAAVALGGGGVPHSSSSAPASVAPSTTPHHTAGPHGATPTPADVATPSDPPSGRPAATPTPGSSSRSPSPSPSPSASPSPSPSPSPTPGVLVASTPKLVLTSTPGKAVIGTFIVTAENGPVSNFVITSLSGKLTISPTSGSLGSGGYVVVTVKAKSKVAFKAKITINPGGLTVTIVLALTLPA